MEVAEAEDMQANSSVGDYDFLQQVGSGTFCVVNLCRYKKNGRVFVVKILSKKKIVYLKQVVHVTQVAARPGAGASRGPSLQEVEILRQVDHPFVVKLYNTMQVQHSAGRPVNRLCCSG